MCSENEQQDHVILGSSSLKSNTGSKSSGTRHNNVNVKPSSSGTNSQGKKSFSGQQPNQHTSTAHFCNGNKISNKTYINAVTSEKKFQDVKLPFLRHASKRPKISSVIDLKKIRAVLARGDPYPIHLTKPKVYVQTK